jgi:hypothetical protein
MSQLVLAPRTLVRRISEDSRGRAMAVERRGGILDILRFCGKICEGEGGEYEIE